MRRYLIISAGIVGALGALIAISAIALFNTGAGRNFIVTQIEKSLGGALASDVEIVSMTGAPPGRIILNDITLSGPDGRWMTIELIELQWRPFAYLEKKIDIDLLFIDGAHLLRRPPEGGDRENEERPFSIRLRDDLPWINVNILTLSNISTDINGETERMSGAGALQMGGSRMKTELSLAGTNDLDAVDITIDFDPALDRLIIDATLNARGDGAIAALTGLNSDLSFSVKNDSPLSMINMRFTGNLGDDRALNGTITNDGSNSDFVDIDLSVIPGDTFAGEVGDAILAKLRIEDRDKGGALIIDQMTMTAGNISGEIAWRNKRRIVDQVDVDLSAAFAAGYRPDLQNFTGQEVTLTGRLNRKKGHYGVEATITGEHTTFSITKGETDLRKKLSGDIAFSLPPPEDARAPFTQRFDLTAYLEADFDKDLALEKLAINTDDGANAYGKARYSFDSNEITLNADLAATPAMISKIAPSVRATSDITAEVDLFGGLDMLTLQSSIETPALQIGENFAPPMVINVALTGLPSLPTGEISARAADKDMQGSFETQFRSSKNGRISLPIIDYHGNGFRLAGAASYDRNERTGNLHLNYKGAGNARPWPGLALEGDLSIDGALTPIDSENRLTVTSNSLRYGEVSVRALSLIADGPLEALNFSVNSNVVATNQTGQINQFNAAATLVTAENPVINLTAFEGVIGGSRAHLTSPAVISFGNGVTINNFRLTDGGNGAIAIDGAFSPTRWQAKASLKDVNIPDADGTISLDLYLDTNAATAASGNFQLRSLLTTGREAAIGGAFLWDGQTLRIESAEDADAIEMEITLPALLSKSPNIVVDTSGALDGYFRYNGDIRVMAPYLPHTLQSLEGNLNANFVISGHAAAPGLSGKAKLTDGNFTELQSGFSLTGLHLEATARLAEETSAIRFTGGAHGAGQSQGDTITLSGDLTLTEQSLLNLAVLLNDAELSATPVSSARLNGRIDIAGSLAAIKATGAITVEELDAEIITPENTGLVDITVIAYDSTAAPGAIVAQEPQLLTDYEIAIAADDRVFIRGRGLESEWSADVTAVNTRDGPLIVGDMNLQRGSLDFSGRRFDLTRGAIAFDRLSANNPLLDIRAEHETTDGVTAVIAVSGRADEPKVELLSTPSMPSENLMALILFGKPAEELSAVESLQTAQALAALGGVGPFGGEGITGTLRQAVGLDLLNFDIDPENGGGSLTIGKYVADGFFVSATQDVQGQTGSVRVEYEVIDNLTIETDIEQDGDQTVSANWKHDF